MNIQSLNIAKNVTLVAAVKGHSVKKIKILLENGVRNLGWSTVQHLRDSYPDLKDINNIRHHFIGHLQRNKVHLLLSYPIELIHSVDSLGLAKKINDVAAEMKKTQKVLLQINADENKEHGLSMDEVREILEKRKEFPNLEFEGLMVIPSKNGNCRYIYKGLRMQRDKLEKEFKNPLSRLSMGMSDDYLIAIEEGATMVRLGRILFQE
ncbi:MAG: YggS family pyridoxal phosphate-dependent enzyme [Candidatus Peregrinibacteria bacterium]|nr:YggS family pyridoxal phosphate-dependent enzyme [Candidatus Peregrinibacteria bacterium]